MSVWTAAKNSEAVETCLKAVPTQKKPVEAKTKNDAPLVPDNKISQEAQALNPKP